MVIIHKTDVRRVDNKTEIVTAVAGDAREREKGKDKNKRGCSRANGEN